MSLTSSKGGTKSTMARAPAYGKERLCEECGRPIEKGREHHVLCRRCEQELIRRKRKGERLRQNRRNSYRDEF